MGRTYSYRDTWPEIRDHIQKMTVHGQRAPEFETYARFAITNKPIYLDAERNTTVPWPLIACIHRREDPSFNAYLGNGQSLSIRTTIEPVGRGPFCRSLPATSAQFISGCIDALAIDGLSHVTQPGDRYEEGVFWGSWPVEKMLFFAERLNGLGYRMRGLPSPYIWGGTNIQVSGKYVSDGVFNPDYWDSQPGCAPILWTIGHLDPSVHFTRET